MSPPSDRGTRSAHAARGTRGAARRLGAMKTLKRTLALSAVALLVVAACSAGASPTPVTTAAGDLVMRITTGADGTYDVPLGPGVYTLTPQPVEGLMGTPEAQLVRLGAGGGGGPHALPFH